MLFRYKPLPTGTVSDDPTPEYMNLLGMIFSMCGLMLKVSNLFYVASCVHLKIVGDLLLYAIFYIDTA